jgi:hypothetical protein
MISPGAEVARNGVFEIVPGRNHRGEHIFSVIVKRSYRFTSSAVVEREVVDRPLRKVDEYYEDVEPERSPVRYESDLAPYKAGTDVVVIGRAYAPRGVPTTRMAVSVQVAGRSKVLAVTGDRECRHRPGLPPAFTDPKPFVEMEIRYDRAYGGSDAKSLPSVPFLYPRNFKGVGVVLRNSKEAVDGLPLPNIEEPQDLIAPERLLIEEPDRWHLQPLPQGLGWFQREWYPRSAMLGSFPPFIDPGTVTTEERLGLLPHDHVALAKQSRLRTMEAQFACGASLGMVFPGLKGDEDVALDGLTPGGRLGFRLPGDRPDIGLDLGGGLQSLQVELHTVCIQPDEGELDLVWRGAQTYEGYGWLPKMRRLHAEVA